MYQKVIGFIKSVYGNQEFTPLAVPVFVGNEKKYLNECIDTTFVSSVGKFVDRLRKTCCSMCKWHQCPPHELNARGCKA